MKATEKYKIKVIAERVKTSGTHEPLEGLSGYHCCTTHARLSDEIPIFVS